jgi:large subunit ribosomal protein L15
MFQSDLPPVPGSVHKKKRVGRGNASGHGTYSGRGIKGQKSRTGRDLRIGFEGGQIPLVRALSRVRGFRNPFRIDFEPVNLDRLARAAVKGEVTPESLKAAGVVKSNRPVKVLGGGEVTEKLKVTAHRFSASARARIEAAGGSVVELMPLAEKPAPEAPPVSAEAAVEPVATVAEAVPPPEAPAAAEPAGPAEAPPAPRRRRRPAAEAGEQAD